MFEWKIEWMIKWLIKWMNMWMNRNIDLMFENSELAENSDLIKISLLRQMKMNEWMNEWVSEWAEWKG